MTGVSLSDVMSETTVESTSESSGDDSDDDFEMPAIFGEIGADVERVLQFHENQPDNFDDLAEFADALANDDDLWSLMEEYRVLVDLHRINLRHLRGEREGDFMDAWRQTLYGDSDDPAEGTKNDLQAQIQEHDHANLPRYKVMFPEPDEDHFPGAPVKWSEGMDAFEELTLPTEDGQDSHIWVTEDFAREFAPFAAEIEGQPRPLPPAEPPEGSGTPTIDPSAYSVDHLKDALEGVDDIDELEAILEYEKGHDDRKTAKQAIERQIEAASEDDGGVTLSDEQVEALKDAGIDVASL